MAVFFQLFNVEYVGHLKRQTEALAKVVKAFQRSAVQLFYVFRCRRFTLFFDQRLVFFVNFYGLVVYLSQLLQGGIALAPLIGIGVSRQVCALEFGLFFKRLDKGLRVGYLLRIHLLRKPSAHLHGSRPTLDVCLVPRYGFI